MELMRVYIQSIRLHIGYERHVNVSQYLSLRKQQKTNLMEVTMKTAVVSAFPACGKTYAYTHFQSRYSMLDSDSSEFSWVKDADGKNTKTRNPDFPMNYIKHIQENIGKVDFIFVSSHLAVRKALEEAGIRYCTVYPKANMKNEWVGRMWLRGSADSAIRFIAENFEGFVSSISDEPHGFDIVRIGAGEYMPLDFLYGLF